MFRDIAKFKKMVAQNAGNTPQAPAQIKNDYNIGNAGNQLHLIMKKPIDQLSFDCSRVIMETIKTLTGRDGNVEECVLRRYAVKFAERELALQKNVKL